VHLLLIYACEMRQQDFFACDFIALIVGLAGREGGAEGGKAAHLRLPVSYFYFLLQDSSSSSPSSCHSHSASFSRCSFIRTVCHANSKQANNAADANEVAVGWRK